MSNTVIQVNKVKKKFSDAMVIHDVNFEIKKGEAVALLGTNGAGKTTLIKMILGLLKPTSGTILLNNMSPSLSSSRSDVGLVPQTNHFIDEITTKETLNLVGKHYKSQFLLEALIGHFDLGEFLNKKISVLSEGQKRRLMLAMAFVGKPNVIFLDEPTVGLDIQSRIKLWDFIKEYRMTGDKTIILTTHYLEEAEELADRVLILHKGKIRVDLMSDEFKPSLSKKDRLKDLFVNILETDEF